MLFHAPAELLLHHKTVEQHHVRVQLADEVIEAGAVEGDVLFGDPQAGQIGLVLAFACRAGKGDAPAVGEEAVKQLHHVPAGRR